MPTCRVFIGSSGEQVRLVEWLTAFIASNYAGRLEPVPWTIPWPGGLFTLEHLLKVVEETDASILFWTADDKTWYRNTERQQPRDNLVFEAGLFLAAHGRDRTQLLLPTYASSDARKDVAVPSDVLGLTWNGFAWSDGPAALPVCRPRPVLCAINSPPLARARASQLLFLLL
jgi:predicted nucleotide-binding protein